MLPDTLQNLPRSERYAYARLLAYMARVDEEITVDELAMFEQQLGKALLSPNQREVLRRSLKSPPSLEECLEGLGPEAGRLALRDAVLMAASDGTVDDDELEVLENLPPPRMVRENASMQHVRIRDDDVPPRADRAAGIRRGVTVVGEASHRHIERAHGALQTGHLVLAERLGREQVEGSTSGIVQDLLKDGQVVAEGLS